MKLGFYRLIHTLCTNLYESYKLVLCDIDHIPKSQKTPKTKTISFFGEHVQQQKPFLVMVLNF